jgi:Spy/CpxP family protein refolding chaperone
MADSLDEIETALSDAIDITDDERAHERLEDAREELRELRESGGVDEERADDLETRIDQRLQAVEERDNYDVDTMGAARSPDDENA